MLDTASPVSISLSATNVTVAPGGSFNLSVTFSLNETFDQTLIPVYSGFIIVNSSAPKDYGNLNIPFMGVGANLSTQDVLDTTVGLPSVTPFGIAPNGSITSSAISTFDMSNSNDTPVLNYALRFPSRRVRVDLLPAAPFLPANSTFAGLGILGYFFDLGIYAYFSEILRIKRLFPGPTVLRISIYRTISIRSIGSVISVTVHSHQTVSIDLLHDSSNGWLRTMTTQRIGIPLSRLFSLFRITTPRVTRRVRDGLRDGSM